jgi:hypothetical protein
MAFSTLTRQNSISKFSKVGIFSEFNGLVDISLMSDYADMFGYTFDEIKRYLGDGINKIAQQLGLSNEEILDKISAYYDGYSFDGIAKVFNPFTMLQFMLNKKFSAYWIQSGRQEFLARYLHKKEFDWEAIDGMFVSDSEAREPGEVG